MRRDQINKKSHEEIDSIIDAALAKYVAAQPRAGLEERILANLRTVETRPADRTWRTWRIAMALAVVLVMVATLVWRWTKMAHPPIAKQPSMTTVPIASEATHRQGNSGTAAGQTRRRKVRQTLEHKVAADPKLDVFPSPLPLNEQEKILAIYVGHYPDHAALLAEARMDDLRREAEERRAIAAGERDRKQ
jgi:hypothetical protein